MYILLLSIHGLIRGHDLELGRDADTGGQTKYVVDLARALGERDDITQVDLVTRRVVDPSVSPDYAEPIEPLSEKVRILRIDAGPDEYLPKEQLWDHLDSFVDNLAAYLHEAGHWPNIVHSHYADAGYVGVRLSNLIGAPLVHTGHSLGRDKRQRLLAAGLDSDQIDARYNMLRRIDAEEAVLASADLVITSTHNEIEEQYGLYDYYMPERMRVIPPGTDLKQFHPPTDDDSIAFADEVERFLDEPDKPLILALSRADHRKNIVALVEAYGECAQLQERANLLIVAGNRDDIRDLDEGARNVLTDILITVDAYDLYGHVAIPKHHTADEVPAIYRLAASSRGVFINPALTEPFGLTLLEAAATGLPLVATENGGPVDIIGNCENGLLVDPLDRRQIGDALLQILGDAQTWQTFSERGLAGVRKHYSWQAHAASYRKLLAPLTEKAEPIPDTPPMRRAMVYRDRALFTDLDQSLLGDPQGVERFVAMMRKNKRCSNFGIATGRRLDSLLAELKRRGIPIPDVLITSLGTEIHYTGRLVPDDYWNEHVDHLWKPRAVRRALADVPGLLPQTKIEQSRFKISYHYDPSIAPSVDEISTLLRTSDLTVNVIHAFGQFLDIVPVRASKGLAVRYVAHRFGIPLEHVLVVGGSGADEDMMRGNTLAVVVANRHHEELSQLSEIDNIYFAEQAHANGILEAVEHYDFFRSCRVPVAEPTPESSAQE
ncbi:HAD-IIB family hydrolase [Thiorhodococcus mannitoliphagus]|uniref:sucrose-phosphate synthase n=1 Tax=Thiorhodococcus mannitoliphagus TaxID=329406 RepID=A0A6P1E1Y3_9GAMM|nr:HAD-IIB family hydrolase [Thiorhodococcus mannitoliphagus]NEX23351.1 HAD-IIB family hydrolase [Thiorhodococcus mannitoliphagus]